MNQISNNLVSQAGQMQLGGVPNDTIQALNSVACVILGPVVQKFVYPTVRRAGFNFGPISRMASAFITMSTAMAFAAGVQRIIYSRGPCYEQPLHCSGADRGQSPNDISVWVQTPVYFILALAEILGFTTLFEYSYSEAPENMRALVQALAQLSSCIGSGLGMAVAPLASDPKVLYLYVGLAAVMIVTAPLFWYKFKSLEKESTQHGEH
jgi:POT family proton-dependent oligopeptide transporter